MAKENKGNLPGEVTLANAAEKPSISDLFEHNRNTITYILIGILVAVAGYLLYHNMVLVPKEKEAIEQMAQAQLQFERDSFALALTNPAPGFLGFVDLAKEFSGTKAGNLDRHHTFPSSLVHTRGAQITQALQSTELAQ